MFTCNTSVMVPGTTYSEALEQFGARLSLVVGAVATRVVKERGVLAVIGTVGGQELTVEATPLHQPNTLAHPQLTDPKVHVTVTVEADTRQLDPWVLLDEVTTAVEQLLADSEEAAAIQVDNVTPIVTVVNSDVSISDGGTKKYFLSSERRHSAAVHDITTPARERAA
ncbi:hypothetical protein JNJ66_01890 [Candidatus Saccharibacteria bacterium]|nr:hypothetical protein [Candidatus Saccharibacteria bacterium]